ncbi:cupin domain-containing protein [Sphingomonas sp. NSE70-1]|uniref:Cupin domain-containing protein n=1 Tax=Sphingomonas caseinilyticus TaxID=2908205 RepID=A0ABT0RWC2_9SPHN|nr:cupin domain-containing protein [Sphingomonas caseinilyticus]MCL6699128.1 cupin domain-containing protein [Sphingomonas caseinilyticus]
MTAARSLYTYPIHLGLGATAVAQPEFTGMEWYDEYGRRAAADGREGRLVSLYRFDESWAMWEMHPVGDEVVACIEGSMILHQEMADGSKASVALGPGDYAINPAGAWHTADIDGSALALFITAGEGTEHRPR